MKVLEKGIMPDGTVIQIEEWNEDYKFLSYGSTLATYPKSKISLEGQFSPKANERYRFELKFDSYKETKEAFQNLIEGKIVLSDFKDKLYDRRYVDCI